MEDHSSVDDKVDVKSQEIEDPDAGLSFEEREKIVGYPFCASIERNRIANSKNRIATWYESLTTN
jgi:hypothetical protein